MATVFVTDRLIRLESSDEVEEFIRDTEAFLTKSGALKGLGGYKGFDRGMLQSMRYHDFRIGGPLFCRHCEDCSWALCGWSSATQLDIAE